MDLVTTIVGKAAELCIDPIMRESSYMFCYKSKVENLEQKIQDLKAARERVESDVTDATRKGEEVLQTVKDWQGRAEKIVEEPEKDLEDGGISNKDKAKCCFGLCPDLKSRYELSKQADKEAGNIVRLLEQEGRFRGKVSYPVDPQEIWAKSYGSYMPFESRKFIFDEILGALKDASVERIGVHGATGIGKTTLVMEVAREAKADKLFDVVVLAVVTRTPDVRRIQGEIADFLGFKIDEESVAARATRLSTRLRKEKKILVILDDIWTSLRLDEIGISFGDHQHRRCKMIITSRDPNVLSEMNAQRSFPVDLLGEEEAWELFKRMAGDIVEHPVAQSSAIDACRRCGGLPISIVAAAKKWKYKTYLESENALQLLKGLSPTTAADPRSAIEFCFNHLANEDLKYAFLLCSLMPHSATIFDLLKYGMAFSFLGEIRKMEGLQRLHRLIQNLKSSRLLQNDRMAEEFTMHDTIGDVAASIASKERQMFLMKNEIGPRDLPDADTPADLLTAIKWRLSYLANEDLKYAFLLCSLMPYNATIFHLLKYGTAFGLLGEIRKMEERQRLHSLARNLESSCLLLDGCRAEEFRVNDGIRDVAASIASRDGQMFLMKSEIGSRDLPDAGMLGKCSVMSLLYNDFVNLPDQLPCPQLQIFQLYNKNSSLKIPDQFFMRTNELKVLDLKGLSSLPSSLGLLGDLRTFCLESCLLQDVAMVANLKKLEILSFYDSIIEELPKEIGQLTQLRLLNLDNCSKLRVIPPNVISNLSQLEELNIGNSFSQWGDDQRAGHASLSELKHLPNLTCLNLHIPDPRNMPKELFFLKLRRFRILIGETWDWQDKCEALRTLKLKLNESIHDNYGVQMLLRKTENLYLDELKYVGNILNELDGTRKGFPLLKHLHLQNGTEMKYIFDSIEAFPLDAFLTLESLCLQNLINLEKICNGQLRRQPFGKLRTLKLRNCCILKNLFSFSIARGLLMLQEIEVVDCKNMEEIIADVREDDVGEIAVTSRIEFGRLQLLTLQQLPKLTSFKRRNTGRALFNKEVTFSNLENLKLSSINAPCIWHDELLSVPTYFENLTSITVEGCTNLKVLLSSSMVNSLNQLVHLEISDCHLIKDIIEAKAGEEETKYFLFPNLNSLKIKGLPSLTRFCLGKVVEFPSLKQLLIEHCPILETFVSKFVKEEMRVIKERKEMASSIQPLFNEKVGFPILENMKISNLRSLAMLWNDQLRKDSFGKLKTLEVEYCGKVQTIFPLNMVARFQMLEVLIIKCCDSLEELFGFQGLSVEENKAEAAVPLKKLYMYNLPKLKHVWSRDPQGIIDFQGLNFVYAFDCQGLKNLFPASVARGLKQLERVDIDNCPVEEIVSKDENPRAETRFVFPKLLIIRLLNLQKLRSFYPGVHSTEWPMLKKIVSYHCGDLMIFGSGKMQMVSQPLFLVEKVVHNVEEISLNSNDISLLSHEVFPANLFSNIKVLLVHCYHQESAVFPFGFIRNFTNLEKLQVDCCKFRELFPTGEEEADNLPRTLAKVRSLKLVLLHNLSHIWRPSSRADLILPNLEVLVVWHCFSMVKLAPSSSSFSNLTTLDVWDCHRAKNIIASSTARNLAQLTKMSVRKCNKVAEIVADDDDDVEEETPKEIIFSKLVCLELIQLPSLKCFSSGNYALKLPSLEDVTVKQCPSWSYLHLGELSTPKLHKV